MQRPGRPDWPFDIRRLPFFYGWVIWLVSTLGFLVSIPGQTMGMAVYTDHLIEALGLTRTQLSLAYLVGTVVSSLFLTRAGRWYDRLGGRAMVALSSLVLALTLLFISQADALARALGGGAVAGFACIAVGYFGVRFLGQGVLTSASRNVLQPWFEKRRGLVSSARGVFVSLGFSMAPLVLAWLIGLGGWKASLWYLALACGVFSLLAFLLLRDNPTACGVQADGHSGAAADSGSVLPRSATLAQAMSSPVFWIYCLSLAMHSLVITALTFHIVSIFAEAGRAPAEAFGVFLPIALVSTSTNLLAGWLADTRPLKPFLVLMLSAFITGVCGALALEVAWGYALLVGGLGIGNGLWSVTSNLAFVRNFGLLHLGEISGLCTAIMVFASAIGPAAFSLGLDVFGNYAAVEMAALLLLLALLAGAVIIPHRHEYLPQ